YTDETILPALVIDYELPWASFTSSSSYFQRDIERVGDATGLDSGYQGELAEESQGFGASFIGNLLSQSIDDNRFKSFTEELRLDSHDDQCLEWTLGAFYSRAESRVSHKEYSHGTNAATELLYGLTPLDVFGVPFPNDIVFTYDYDDITEEAALFGQLGYTF